MDEAKQLYGSILAALRSMDLSQLEQFKSMLSVVEAEVWEIVEKQRMING